MVAVGWTEAQRKAYVIADNKLALGADWDEAILRTEFATLQELKFDVGLTGFSGTEIGALMALGAGGGLTDPDEAPEPPASPVSRPGDIWLLGEHRLVCGDSTSVESVAAALNGVKPHLMVTDPPYGVDYDPDWRNRADRAKGKPSESHRQGRERWPIRLARGLCIVPGRCCLRLACRSACQFRSILDRSGRVHSHYVPLSVPQFGRPEGAWHA
jgi:hypothetical protein